MKTSKRRPAIRVERGKKTPRTAFSPYLVEEVTFTLEEIRRARENAA